MNGTIFVTMMALFIPPPLLFAREAQTAAPEKMKAIVTQVFPLSEVAKAQDQIATRHTRGKIVLRVAPDPKS